MKTAQDSYTITIKHIVSFQERMHLKKFQFDKIQNSRLWAIIHLDRPHIAEYHERMHFEKNQLDQVQNGRLLAIIHLDRPDIG